MLGLSAGSSLAISGVLGTTASSSNCNLVAPGGASRNKDPGESKVSSCVCRGVCTMRCKLPIMRAICRRRNPD